MSYLSKQQRLSFIHNRLKYKKDFPSTKTLVRYYFNEYGDDVSSKTFQRDIEQRRNQGAPLVYDSSRKGYFYTDETYSLEVKQLQSADFLSLLVIERAMDSYKNSPYYTRLKKIFDQLTESSPELVNISNTEYLSHISIITEATSKINLDLWPIIEKGLTRYKKLIKYLPGD